LNQEVQEMNEIIIDYREKADELISFLQSQGIAVKVEKLSFGDYLLDGAVTVERKCASDFVTSIIDGRLFKQVANLKRHAPRPVLIIEGNPYRTGFNMDNRAIEGALLSLQTVWYLPVLFSKTLIETAGRLIMICKQHAEFNDVVTLRWGYRPKRLATRKLYLLQGLPGIGPDLAKRMLDHFDSVSGIFNASIKELTTVKGIGSTKAKKIREILD